MQFGRGWCLGASIPIAASCRVVQVAVLFKLLVCFCVANPRRQLGRLRPNLDEALQWWRLLNFEKLNEFVREGQELRWPLRNKILVRLALLLLGTVAVITLANLRVIQSTNRRVFDERINRIGELVAHSTFPLTNNVLNDMGQLAGVELGVVDGQGHLISRSAGLEGSTDWLVSDQAREDPAASSRTVTWQGRRFVHVVLPLNRPPGDRISAEAVAVHILIDQQQYRDIFWSSLRMPVVVAAGITPLACLLGLALASSVTRPLSELQRQVRKISEGDLTIEPTPRGNDEISDLQRSVGDLVHQLRDHDEQLRRNERLNTLVQMGNGIAHNLKNCVTGCKMALDLLARERPDLSESENAQVAQSQLAFMNTYIDRFLKLGRSGPDSRSSRNQAIDLAATLDSVEFLLQPVIKHLKIDFSCRMASSGSLVQIPPDDAHQLLVNLINNAVEAASRRAVQRRDVSGQVQVELTAESGTVQVIVRDNGVGPPENLGDSMFDPFVTGNPEGVGLGLAVVAEIVEDCRGDLSWRRADGWTIFTVSLPTAGRAE